MKNRTINYVVIFAVLVLAVSCVKDDAIKDVGIKKIYMPQASIKDGGVTNNYPVPISWNNGVKNYKWDTLAKTLDIKLGVAESGGSTEGGFSVNVNVNEDTAAEIINNQSIPSAVLLPKGSYQLPGSVSVMPGQTETSFSLKVDLAKLVQIDPLLYKKKLILPVSISNSTKGEINSALSTTVVVIDGSAFLPKPPLKNLLIAGNFEDGSDAHWTITEVQPWNNTKKATITIGGGKINYDNGENDGVVNHMIWQEVQLEKGRKYKVNLEVLIGGNVSNSWFELYLGTHMPDVTMDYNENLLYKLNSWDGCFSTSGELPKIACNANTTEDTFTATYTGKAYFVIKLGSWQGHILNLSIKNALLADVTDM